MLLLIKINRGFVISRITCYWLVQFFRPPDCSTGGIRHGVKCPRFCLCVDCILIIVVYLIIIWV